MIHGPLIKTKFLGPTTHREPRVMASHQRDSKRTWHKATYWNPEESALENHRLAALALIRSSPMAEWQAQIVASGFDQDHYYWIVSTPSMTSA